MESDQPPAAPLGENTRAVHLPPPPTVAQQPLGVPIYRTAAFAFSSSAEYAALLDGAAAGYSYSRIDNPTADTFALSVALTFATAVASHPAVRRVAYPGLPGHPGHETARRLFDTGPEGTRFGAIVTVTPHGGRAAGYGFADRLRVAQVATSLGGTHTQVSPVASTTHRQLDDAALAAAGIDPGTVRFSIGLEDAGDLIEDAYQALDAVRERA
jgi:O-acetylhomoserine/O-acetylserine sulfhydrylase-like pyridoxal-dependent enzyme